MLSKIFTTSRLGAVIALLGGVAFYFSTKAAHHHFDYTFRIAQALLRGHAGLNAKAPSWLSEMVPLDGHYYSVFPLGAVLSNVPLALLRKMGLIRDWPAHELAALLAAGCIYFFYRLSFIREMSQPRRVLLALFPIFATWAWTNLGFAGAWQIALGFALLGEAGALYYTLVRPKPLLAGFWFAVAFGNRTEVILTLPIFIYFWLARPQDAINGSVSPSEESIWLRLRNWRFPKLDLRRIIASPKFRELVWFGAIPAALLLATAGYNFVRFHSLTDFGYAKIPGVLNEPWYRHGLFSLHAIRWNAHEMLFRGLIDIDKFPYWQPHAFGCSIFFASPFLFLLFREGGKLRLPCWLTIGGLTFFLWCHGNPGGWQFSYRYAIVLLPWMFLLLAENGPRKLTATESGLFLVTVLFNAVAVYEFLWTNMIHV
jgi:hypothetical protein